MSKRMSIIEGIQDSCNRGRELRKQLAIVFGVITRMLKAPKNLESIKDIRGETMSYLIKVPEQEKNECYLFYFEKYYNELMYNKGYYLKHCEWPLENNNCPYLKFGCKGCLKYV